MKDLREIIDGYNSWQQDARNARRKQTNEIFTPYDIVIKMMNRIPDEDWANPDKTFLEPCCGSGNFIMGILYRRIYEYHLDYITVLNNLYALDLIPDNIKETRERIHELLHNISPNYIPEVADKIMDRNIVCHDFFLWNFEEWRPYTDEEINDLVKRGEINKKYKR